MNSHKLRNMEEAELAYQRVKPELNEISPSKLAPMNLDIVSATSTILGVSGRVKPYLERLEKLPEFDMRDAKNLEDYALAAWYVYLTNLPALDSSEGAKLFEEVAALRSKMMLWAEPLVKSGIFDEAAYAKIKEGSGRKDTASDAVALVGLYRSKWKQIRNMCGVTEDDLNRAAVIAPAVFAWVAQTENKEPGSTTQASLRVRQAWTRADRAYSQCKRAIGFLRYDEDDVDLILPSLRRNPGPRQPSEPTEPDDTDTTTPGEAPPSSVTAPTGAGTHSTPAAPTAPVIGSGGAPFLSTKS